MFGLNNTTTPLSAEQAPEAKKSDSRTTLNQHYWMPFSANRDFLANPRVIAGAKGRYHILAKITPSRLGGSFASPSSWHQGKP